MWIVSMKGREGYTCEVKVTYSNANNTVQAQAIAAMMFPELRVVDCIWKEEAR